MKKLASSITIFLIAVASIFAQNKPAVVAKPKPAKKVEAKLAVKAATPVKKDGTPDLRFKANKPAPGPKKKDGTADMRYKANKTIKKS